MPGGFYQLWFAVRYLHVAAATILIGGAALVTALCSAPRAAAAPTAALDAAVAYEWMFWTVAAVLVATGFSNLGLKGNGLMDAETQWGGALTTKLAAALLVLSFAAMRTDVVITLRAASAHSEPTMRRLLASLYGITAAALLGILWLGLGLAHGRY